MKTSLFLKSTSLAFLASAVTDKEAPPVSICPKMPISKLPLPAGALDVEYKEAVGHITFRSDSSVSAVSKDFAAKVKAQCWKEAPGSRIGKANAILRRNLHGADLTIVVQPAGKGSSTKVFTQGLDWTDAPASAAPAEAPEVSGIDAEANRFIKDALKGLPKF
jgi:hypothetical protein